MLANVLEGLKIAKLVCVINLADVRLFFIKISVQNTYYLNLRVIVNGLRI